MGFGNVVFVIGWPTIAICWSTNHPKATGLSLTNVKAPTIPRRYHSPMNQQINGHKIRQLLKPPTFKPPSISTKMGP